MLPISDNMLHENNAGPDPDQFGPILPENGHIKIFAPFIAKTYGFDFFARMVGQFSRSPD